MDKIKLGIIGMGRWARQAHLRNLRQLPQFQVTAVSSRNDDNISKALEITGEGPLVFRDWTELLESEEVEAVIIATPNHTHEEIACLALESGKHVLVEKPPALTVQGCDRLIETARKTDKILQVGFELRYSDLYRHVAELIAGGDIGNLRLMRCMNFRGPFFGSWRLSSELSGGPLLELSTHHFDLFNFFAGEKPVRVCAMGGVNTSVESDILDNSTVIIEYDRSVRATLLMCLFSSWDNKLKFGITGDNGGIDCYDKSQKIIKHSALSPNCREYSIASRAGIVEYEHHGTLRQMESFAECIRCGVLPRANGLAGKWSVAVAVAAARSIKEGIFVETGL